MVARHTRFIQVFVFGSELYVSSVSAGMLTPRVEEPSLHILSVGPAEGIFTYFAEATAPTDTGRAEQMEKCLISTLSF